MRIVFIPEQCIINLAMDHGSSPIISLVFDFLRIADFSSADGYPSPVPAKHPERRALAGFPGHAHPGRPRHRPRRHRPLLLIFLTSFPDVGEWAKPEKLLTGPFRSKEAT